MAVGKIKGSVGVRILAVLLVGFVASVQAVPISDGLRLREHDGGARERVVRSAGLTFPLDWDQFQDSNLKIYQYGIPVGTTELADLIDDGPIREATGEGWGEKFQTISKYCGNLRSFNERRCAWDHLEFMNRDLEEDAQYTQDELTFAFIFVVCDPTGEGVRMLDMKPHCPSPCMADPCDAGSVCQDEGHYSGQNTCTPPPTPPRPAVQVRVNAQPFRASPPTPVIRPTPDTTRPIPVRSRRPMPLTPAKICWQAAKGDKVAFRKCVLERNPGRVTFNGESFSPTLGSSVSETEPSVVTTTEVVTTARPAVQNLPARCPNRKRFPNAYRTCRKMKRLGRTSMTEIPVTTPESDTEAAEEPSVSIIVKTSGTGSESKGCAATANGDEAAFRKCVLEKNGGRFNFNGESYSPTLGDAESEITEAPVVTVTQATVLESSGSSSGNRVPARCPNRKRFPSAYRTCRKMQRQGKTSMTIIPKSVTTPESDTEAEEEPSVSIIVKTSGTGSESKGCAATANGDEAAFRKCVLEKNGGRFNINGESYSPTLGDVESKSTDAPASAVTESPDVAASSGASTPRNTAPARCPSRKRFPKAYRTCRKMQRQGKTSMTVIPKTKTTPSTEIDEEIEEELEELEEVDKKLNQVEAAEEKEEEAEDEEEEEFEEFEFEEFEEE